MLLTKVPYSVLRMPPERHRTRDVSRTIWYSKAEAENMTDKRSSPKENSAK
jgi:hypothetical protein